MGFNLETYYNSRTRIFWHIAFWVILVLYHTIIYSMYSGNFSYELMWEGMALPVKMGATYFTLYLLLPRYFMNRQFIRFSIFIVIVLMIAAFLQRVIEFSIINLFINPYERAETLLNPIKVLRAVIGIYPVVALAAFIKVGKYWYRRDLESRELEREKLEAELKFLKAQIHPHFLFNTLNNLYALTLKRSEDASEVVLKLSDLLNYMLYEGRERTVSLARELELVETYIALEKIRYGDRLELSYRVSGNPEGKQIPPMLLLPFVENSFKHGASKELEQVQVTIEIEVKENRFTLRVENDKSDTIPEAGQGLNEEGIGLKNVKRRLELLYGEGHTLEISDIDSRFRIELTLETDRMLKPGAP